MLKSNIHFKSLGGVRCPALNASPEDKKRWRNMRIGMFIHWGLYSILGRGEWVRFNEQLSPETYEPLADEFIPQQFEMSSWMEIARDFGARYCVMVTRHHDGFALWNSDASYEHFTSWHRGAHRDFVREYTDACRAAGMAVGLYYSPMDWRFPGYFDPVGLAENAALMKAQCYGQVAELVQNYGAIDILWYDGGWLAHKGSDTSSAWFWEPEKLNRIVKEAQPHILCNPRSGWEGDFYCDEGSAEIRGGIIPVPWEKNMCVCSGQSWGYMPDDPPQSFPWLIRMLVNVICRGGNWLVNIGPDRDGRISEEIRVRMRQVGDWIRAHEDAVYGSTPGPWEPVDDVYGAVCHGQYATLFLLDPSQMASQQLPQIPGLHITEAAIQEADGSLHQIRFEQTSAGIRLELPEGWTPTPADPVPTVRLTADAPVQGRADEDISFTGK